MTVDVKIRAVISETKKFTQTMKVPANACFMDVAVEMAGFL